MKKIIGILGCGWLGIALAIKLIEKGHKVYGSTTSHTNLNRLESYGITSSIIDITERDADISDFLISDILIIAIPSKSIEDFKNLIRKIEKSKIRKVVFVSSTSVYPNTNGIVTEETQTKNSPLAQIEKLFIENSVFESTVIRFGGLFGYDRKPGNFIKFHKKVDNPKGFINFIHRDDCVRIIEQIIVKNTWNKILNACADSHPLRRDFYLKEVKKLGVTNLVFNEQSESSFKIVSSQKLIDLLSYEFKYDDLMNYEKKVSI